MLETRLHPDNVPSYLQSEVGYLLEGRFLQARINLPINGFVAKLLALGQETQSSQTLVKFC